MSPVSARPHRLLEEPVGHEVDITESLASRTARLPDYKTENAALGRLAETLATAPETMAEALAQAALVLKGAQSAGLSLAEELDGESIFRWVATAGAFGPR